MSRNDITIIDTGGHNCVPVLRWLVDDRTTSSANQILAGEPTKQGAAASQFVIPCVDGDLTIGTDQPFTGIAAADSTETTSADGYVDLYVPLPGVVYEIKALSAAAANTQSEIDAMRGENQVLDLTSGAFTMDTAAGGSANNAFTIVGGDPLKSTVWFTVRIDATYLGDGQN